MAAMSSMPASGAEIGRADVVDDDVGVGNLGDERLRAFHRREVGRDAGYVALGNSVPDLSHRLVDARVSATVDDDGRTGTRQPFRRCKPDPGCGPGHHGRPAAEVDTHDVNPVSGSIGKKTRTMTPQACGSGARTPYPTPQGE
jgi:hypothetical protein